MGRLIQMKKLSFFNRNNNLSIRMRIILSFEIVVLISVILLQITVSIFLHSYYYSGAEQILRDRVTFEFKFHQ